MSHIKKTGKPLCESCPYNLSKGGVWLDKQDILTRMLISSRTLQSWRSKGILPFIQIGKKIYYRECDLDKLMKP